MKIALDKLKKLAKSEDKEGVAEDARTDAEQEGYKDGFNDVKGDVKDALSKMKVSELKAKIRENILSTLNEADEEVDVNKILSNGGYDIIDDEKLLMTVKSRLKGNSDISAKDLNLLVMKIEDGEGGNIDFSEALDMTASPETLRKIIFQLLDDGHIQSETADDILNAVSNSPSNNIYEADEEVDVDIDVEDEVEVDAEADDIEIERPGVKTTVDVGLSPEEEVVQDSLKAAMDAANELGNQKLADQIGNTITFFTREFVVGQNTD